MKKYLFALIAPALLVSCGEKSITNKEESVAKVASISEGDVLIDVRSAEEHETGYLKGSINIPHTEIGEEIADHVKSKATKIVLYCRSGNRAGTALKTLTEMGYTNVSNVGGYKDLKE